MENLINGKFNKQFKNGCWIKDFDDNLVMHCKTDNKKLRPIKWYISVNFSNDFLTGIKITLVNQWKEVILALIIIMELHENKIKYVYIPMDNT